MTSNFCSRVGVPTEAEAHVPFQPVQEGSLAEVGAARRGGVEAESRRNSQALACRRVACVS